MYVTYEALFGFAGLLLTAIGGTAAFIFGIISVNKKK